MNSMDQKCTEEEINRLTKFFQLLIEIDRRECFTVTAKEFRALQLMKAKEKELSHKETDQ